MAPWRIIHDDCLSALQRMEAGSVDIVVTSPPYNTLPAKAKPSGLRAEFKSGDKWLKKAASGYFDQRPEDEYQQWLVQVVGECIRVSKGLVWVNHKVRYRNGFAVHPVRFLPFPIYSEVVWDRGGSMALNCKRYAPSHECIIAFGRKHYWDDSLNTKLSVWRISPQRSDDHPCPFPLEIPWRLIRSSCPEGGTVLDPFAGSGTTGIAAVNLKRRFVGIEKEAKYVSLATNRLSISTSIFDEVDYGTN